MAGGKQNNPFDFLSQLGEMGDVRKFLGQDFFKNLPLPNMQNGAFFNDADSTADEYPQVDLYNRSSELIAVIALPGLKSANDVSLSVRPHYLRVRGNVPHYFSTGHEQMLMHECHHGAFDREIELPERVVADDVKASYRSGMLIVYLRKDQSPEQSRDSVLIDFSSDD
ncbi:Hsp20/alpha crystallin family protein [Alicyclobacillus acidiphilus]|uniref:Hsp20/alpha crystallin family protein n=1 Tax=Alicyclobacillus acidiphilus TaxID=182455 RepID=UPI0008365C9F|nr:Hsp20/alpha crystallin family protein [Alicyclobacillus acidiphilus]